MFQYTHRKIESIAMYHMENLYPKFNIFVSLFDHIYIYFNGTPTKKNQSQYIICKIICILNLIYLYLYLITYFYRYTYWKNRIDRAIYLYPKFNIFVSLFIHIFLSMKIIGFVGINSLCTRIFLDIQIIWICWESESSKKKKKTFYLICQLY